MTRLRFAGILVLNIVLLACRGDAAERAGDHGEHAEHDEHGEHSEHDEHGEHDDGHEHDALPTRVELSPEVIADAGIVVEPARRQVVAPTLIATGHVEADPGRTAQVPARVGGLVEEVRFREGDVVAEGTALAILRAPSLGSLRADLAALQARAASARANLERLQALAERAMASQQDLAAARAEATALEVEAKAAKQRLRALGLAAKGDATVFALRAPIAGVVTRRGVVPGQAVDPEASVATIVSLEQAWFVARIFEHMLARVRVGAAAEVTLNAHPDHPLPGHVEYLSHEIDAEAQTIVARIPIDNREDLLRIGLFGSARIAVTSALDAPVPVLAVPSGALVDIDGRPVVFVRHHGGVFERHDVVLGTQGAGVVEILQGIDEGEPVVTRGAWTLKSVLLRGTFGEEHGH